MNKFDYFYSRIVGKLLSASEVLGRLFIPSRARGVQRKLNIKYGAGSNKLDLIYCEQNGRQGGGQKLPILFYIHGGGFISGTLGMRRPYCYSMAKSGFFVVNVGYTLAPKAHFPSQLHDIFAAIDYVLDRADEYNLDTGNICLAGESAGAYFALYIAAITRDKSLYQQYNIDFRRKSGFDVRALALINGSYRVQDILQANAPFVRQYVKAFFNLNNRDLKNNAVINRLEFNPVDYINADFPKCVVIGGKHDVFGRGTRTLLRVLTEQEARHSVHMVTGFAGLHAVSISLLTSRARAAQRFVADEFMTELASKQSQ